MVNTISYPYHIHTEIISTWTAGLRNKFTDRHPIAAFMFIIVNEVQILENNSNHWCSNQRKMFLVLMMPENREQLLPDSSVLLSRGTKQFISSKQQVRDSVPALGVINLQRTANPYKEYFPLGCKSQF